MANKDNAGLTGKGAVTLEESQLAEAQGGIIAVAPANTIVIKGDSPIRKSIDGGGVKISDGSSNTVKFFP